MIYIPSHFNEANTGELHRLMERFAFATLLTSVDGQIHVTHLPLLLNGNAGTLGTLTGHMARANPHWTYLTDGASLAIFHGPHRYISPTWYDDQPSVPTWNFAVVHAKGRCQLFEDEERLLQLTNRMTERFERENGTNWRLPDNPDYLSKMTAQIVGFDFVIDQLHGKYKLSQNRSVGDRRNVIAALQKIDDDGNRELVELMEPRAG